MDRRGVGGTVLFEFLQDACGNFANIPYEPEEAEGADDVVADIDLPPMKSCASGGSIAVMIVVPGSAHRRDGHPPNIAAVIRCFKRSVSEAVAVVERVDRHRDLIGHQGRDHKAPDHGL